MYKYSLIAAFLLVLASLGVGYWHTSTGDSADLELLPEMALFPDNLLRDFKALPMRAVRFDAMSRYEERSSHKGAKKGYSFEKWSFGRDVKDDRLFLLFLGPRGPIKIGSKYMSGDVNSNDLVGYKDVFELSRYLPITMINYQPEKDALRTDPLIGYRYDGQSIQNLNYLTSSGDERTSAFLRSLVELYRDPCSEKDSHSIPYSCRTYLFLFYDYSASKMYAINSEYLSDVLYLAYLGFDSEAFNNNFTTVPVGDLSLGSISYYHIPYTQGMNRLYEPTIFDLSRTRPEEHLHDLTKILEKHAIPSLDQARKEVFSIRDKAAEMYDGRN